MKKVLIAFAVMSAMLASCGQKQVKLEPVAAPSWYQNETYFNEKNGMYQELPIYAENIVLVGDDYIDRGIWSEFYADTTIKNRGITYDASEHVLSRIDGIAAGKPAKIFVEVGRYDVLHGVSTETAAGNISRIFERCKAISPRTKLYYINIVEAGGTEEQIAGFKSLNAAVLEKSHSGLFEYIDVSDFLAEGVKSGKYSWDNGKYLNGAGYEVLARSIERQIGKQHLNTAADKEDKKEITDYYKHRVSMFRSLPATDGKIIMLGNSLNNNACWTELFPFSEIVNRGISGDIISGIDQRLDEIVRHNPSKIFLQSGCNDMYNKEKVVISNVWADFEKLIKDIRTQLPETDLYVQSILPVREGNPYSDVFNAAAAEVNKLLKAGTEKYGYFYLDIAAKLSDEKGNLRADLTFDGIHLNAEGYFIWATELLQGNRLIILTKPEDLYSL